MTFNITKLSSKNAWFEKSSKCCDFESIRAITMLLPTNRRSFHNIWHKNVLLGVKKTFAFLTKIVRGLIGWQLMDYNVGCQKYASSFSRIKKTFAEMITEHVEQSSIIPLLNSHVLVADKHSLTTLTRWSDRHSIAQLFFYFWLARVLIATHSSGREM